MTKKIIIIGTSGSGKSTLAIKLSQKFDIPHIEMDTLYWGPHWTLNTHFIKNLTEEIQQSDWIICGNYSRMRDLIWSRGTHLIWLDYPFHLVFWRAFKRALIRIITKKQVCGENRESFKRLFSRQSILLWVIQTYWRRKKEYKKLFDEHDYPDLSLFRLHSPQEVEECIQDIK